MGIPAGVAKVTLAGTADTGAEVWNTSFWVTDIVVASDTDANALALSMVTKSASSGFTTALLGLLKTDATFDEIRVHVYNTANAPATYVGVAPVAQNGTGSTNAPLQLAMVATLHTAGSSRRARGRMYLPANGIALAAGHLLDSTTAANVCTKLADFFTAVGNLPNPSATVSVLSQADAATRPVTSVTVDQRPDIQRRRANQQPAGTVASAAVT